MSTNAVDVARQTATILLPEILLLAVAAVMMTAGAFLKYPRRFWALLALAALGAALTALFVIGNQANDVYSAVALNDSFSYFGRMLIVLTGFILLALAHNQVDDARAPEFFGTLLMIEAGAMLVAASNEMVFLFVGLELVSIPTYLLLYLSRRTTTTQEAATKYFFLSIFSSALLLFGLAYLYGLTGVSNLKALTYLVGHVENAPQPFLALIAVVFVVAGLGFRVAAVPFHFYAPDVYQGSPTVVAGLLSWVPKAIGFFAMLRTVTAVVSASDPSGELVRRAVLLAWIIAVVTMTLGNTVALAQQNLKRLLAYSSIAHAGYMMIGVAAAFHNGPEATGAALGAEAILFYLTAYALMTLGVFGAIILLSTPERTVETVDDLNGLAWTHPLPALALMICLFSLAGIPPLMGFLGKFLLFASALSASNGDDAGLFWWLCIAGALNAAVGAYYYMRIVVGMFLREPSGDPLSQARNWPAAIAVAACTVGTIFFGVYSAPIMRATSLAAESAVALPDPMGPPGQVAATIEMR